MAEDPKPFERIDRFGVAWIVRPKPKKISPMNLPVEGVFTYNAALLREPAYNTNPQTDVITFDAKPADAIKKLDDEIEAYITDHLASGGQPPKRASLDVTAKADNRGGWVVLVIIALLALSSKERR